MTRQADVERLAAVHRNAAEIGDKETAALALVDLMDRVASMERRPPRRRRIFGRGRS